MLSYYASCKRTCSMIWIVRTTIGCQSPKTCLLSSLSLLPPGSRVGLTTVSTSEAHSQNAHSSYLFYSPTSPICFHTSQLATLEPTGQRSIQAFRVMHMVINTVLDTLHQIQDRYVLLRSASPISDACRGRTSSDIAFFPRQDREFVVPPLRRADCHSFLAFGNDKISHTSSVEWQREREGSVVS